MTILFHNNLQRSIYFAERIRERKDKEVRRLVDNFNDCHDYEATRNNLLISEPAWEYIISQGFKPRQVFAHPEILIRHPKVSFYYRGFALLSLKRVKDMTKVDVKKWEAKDYVRIVEREKAFKVCCVYNGVISSIVTATSVWSLSDGYRNILNTMGITYDGMFRNVIGQDAEKQIKKRLTDWLDDQGMIVDRKSENSFFLKEEEHVTMIEFGSEPDILFKKDNEVVATIEIKGGRDPAGALERLGAMQKSFTETPPGCQNFLIAGVVTKEMKSRLKQHNVKYFVLDNLLKDDGWDNFTKELFHYTLRIM